MDFLQSLSVIVPLAPGESTWPELARDLDRALPPAAEVLFVGPRAPRANEIWVLENRQMLRRWSWVRAERGRARQLNAAAKAARGRFLWFLHADTRVTPHAVAMLAAALAAAPAALHYFDLAFAGDGPPLMPLNAAGVWWRSRCLGMPFGDQGFCLGREIFWGLGGFPEDVPYGEDHLLAWRARQSGVSLRCAGATLTTSARKYRERGWLKTTTRHLYLTYRQAWPEALRLICAKVRGHLSCRRRSPK